MPVWTLHYLSEGLHEFAFAQHGGVERWRQQRHTGPLDCGHRIESYVGYSSAHKRRRVELTPTRRNQSGQSPCGRSGKRTRSPGDFRITLAASAGLSIGVTSTGMSRVESKSGQFPPPVRIAMSNSVALRTSIETSTWIGVAPARL